MRVANIPDTYPFKCRITGQADESAGPYIKLDRQEYDPYTPANPSGRDQYQDVWISRLAIDEMAAHAGIEGNVQEYRKLKNEYSKLEKELREVPRDLDDLREAIMGRINKRFTRIENKLDRIG